METARTAYHHGDLRDALLDAAKRALREEGPTALSLRKLGREVGVTPGAPYRHFADKEALLGALAADGYRMLRAEMLQDIDQADGGEEKMKRLGVGYVRFAIQHPELFRLMCGWAPSYEIPELTDAADAAFEAFENVLEECAAEGLLSRSVRESGLLAWSAVHGAAFLVIDDRLDIDEDEQNAECLLDMLHGGIWAGIGTSR